MPGFQNASSKRDGPPEHEWLFGDRKFLSDEETLAAYYWEFGLEIPDVIAEVASVRSRRALSEKVNPKLVEKWRAANPFPGVVDWARLMEWDTRFKEQFPDYIVATRFRSYDIHFLISWPEFPSQHWSQISERIRKQLDEKRHRPRPGQLGFDGGLKQEERMGGFDTVPASFYKTESGLVGCHEISLRKGIHNFSNLFSYVPTTKTPYGAASENRWTEFRLVRFSWARSDRKLKSDFAQWLKENRPDDRQAYHKSKESDSRRTTERDLLKALGAFRLLRHFKGNWRAAADYSALFGKDNRGNPKPLYVEQSEWRDAEKKARKALAAFHSKVFTRKVFG